MIYRKQPVERQKARQQRAEPQHRRADTGQQVEVGADGEGHHHHDDQEEQRTHQRAATDAHGQPHVAHEEGGEGGQRRHLQDPLVPAKAGTQRGKSAWKESAGFPLARE